LVLASRSPRRERLLREAGYEFTIEPADIDERAFPAQLAPSETPVHLSRAKARAVAAKFPDHVVLAADTIIVFAERVIGQPKDASDARRIIQLLSGTTHIVVSGVAVQHAARDFAQDARVMSAVRLKLLTPDELDTYIASGQWEGKAGGYGLQDATLVERVGGCRTNVIGLPMKTTKTLLAAAGIQAE
jgi:septum formation protein